MAFRTNQIMGNNLLAQNPFAVLTFIVAPAILTDAASVLAMSIINGLSRRRDRGTNC